MGAGGAIIWIGSGAVGPFVNVVATAFAGLVDHAAASPSATPIPSGLIGDAPSIQVPEEPYTNSDAIDVTVNVPSDVVGADDYTVRLYVTLKDQAPTKVAEEPVGPTSVLVIRDVALAKGRNELQASVVGPGGESELSSYVAWILDTSAPKITVSSPKDGSAVNRDSVTIKGKTQARSAIVVRNEANGASTTGEAGTDGLFAIRIAITAGVNGITITAKDPAGNANSSVLSVRRGSGKLIASLTGSAYRFTASKLPRNVTFRVVVTDPDGRSLAGAKVLFTVQIPGLEAIVSPKLTTAGDGTATFQTRIPKGAQKGGGLATVLVTTSDFGATTDRQVLTVR